MEDESGPSTKAQIRLVLSLRKNSTVLADTECPTVLREVLHGRKSPKCFLLPMTLKHCVEIYSGSRLIFKLVMSFCLLSFSFAQRGDGMLIFLLLFTFVFFHYV